MSKSNGAIMPEKVTWTTWIEQYDLRLLRRDANKLCTMYDLRPGQAALVSGSKYGSGRRFAFLIQTQHGPMVLQPQTGAQNMLLGLMMRVHEYADEVFN